MKLTIEEYKKLPYGMEIKFNPDRGQWLAIFPDLPWCLAEGDSIQKVFEGAQQIKDDFFKFFLSRDMHIPLPLFMTEQKLKEAGLL